MNPQPTAAVAAPHHRATSVGAAILQQGGNAFDAAVTTSLAIGIVQPYHSGIGGGCCINFVTAAGETGCIQARGDAPAALTPQRFWDADGNPDHRLAREGGLAIVVPAQIAGLHAMHERFGLLPWSHVVQVAVPLARNGFPADFMLARLSHMAENRQKLERYSNGMAVGKAFREGTRLIQPELAATLATVAVEPQELYCGALAAQITTTVQAAGGVLTASDLASYRPRWQEVREIRYRGWRILVPQTPTIGALQSALALQILDHFPLSDYLPGSVEHLHLVAEAIKLSYMARAGLESEEEALSIAGAGRARDLALQIQLGRSLPFVHESDAVTPADSRSCTSHFSVADAMGNVVSMTQTVRSWYGSGVVDSQSGILLNDTAGDFSLRVGDITNQGIRYGKYNLVAPGAAPASSQSPVIALHPASGDMIAVGAAGGPTIVSATVQALVNCIEFGMDARASAAMPRVHCHGPELEVEPGVRVADQLAALGHIIKPRESIAILQLLRRSSGVWDGAADPRGPGAAELLANKLVHRQA